MRRHRATRERRIGNRWPRRRLKVLSAVALLALVVSGCDWSQAGFGPDHRSFNPSEPAITESSVANLEAAWSKPCTCAGTLVAGGTVYVVDATTLRAFDAATGASRWSTPIGSDVGLVAVANGLVYLTRRPSAGSHQLVARDASNGASRFTFTPTTVPSQFVSIGEVIVDGPFAFVVATTRVYAINTAGSIVWAKTLAGGTTHLVADPGKTVYIGTSIPVTNGPPHEVPLLTGYRQSDGAVISSVVVRVPSGGAEAMAFANGLVYIFSPFGHGATGVGMSAVDPATGQVKWGDPSEPLAVAGNAVISTSEVHWIASNPATGQQLWERFDAPPFIDGVAVGNLFLRGSSNTLVAHRLSDGSIAGSYPPFAENIRDVVASGGQIFVTTTAQLVAIKPAS